MTSTRGRVVVVGASLAGVQVCEGLRRFGHDGEIVLIGDEPHTPYDRPPLSKEILTGTKAPFEIGLVSPERLRELDVEFRSGLRATGLDVAAKQVHVDDERLTFDHLVVATGAAARPLPGSDDLEGVHLLRAIEDG